MSLSVQQVLQQVKEVKGALVGISRTNTALYHTLLRKLTKLEKDLASSCDTLVDAPEPVDPEPLQENSLEQVSTSKDETSQEEAATLSGEVDGGADAEAEHADDSDLLAALGRTDE
jgi:hypothetical protein